MDGGSGEDLEGDMGRETMIRIYYMETFIFNLKKIAGTQRKPKINKRINLPCQNGVYLWGSGGRGMKCKKAFKKELGRHVMSPGWWL